VDPQMEDRIYQDVLSLVNSWQLATGEALPLQVVIGTIYQQRDVSKLEEAVENLVAAHMLLRAEHSNGFQLVISHHGMQRLKALRLAHPDRTT